MFQYNICIISVSTLSYPSSPSPSLPLPLPLSLSLSLSLSPLPSPSSCLGTRMQSGPESVSDKLSSLDLKGRDITVKQVDVTDSEALGQLMKDKDLCIR